ncbi:hypothetical protein DMA12_47335 [Amycolatopsis balhimycina DSM 5908]|uniref:Uncharacterized protein n=1 Tax=Amycolatopsis balhimycina DSM 5908 TaxID=1081091 RepID=A0A428VV16_AMYBA|nr:hypothetical protein [Amycolatopsis balhimycina]RSM34670.1 hypothetical protein DMA12_47335 [Amycolatopsis balhimycina DSM 5908]
MVAGGHHLAEFRVRGVYSPAVFRELARPPADRGIRLRESEDEAWQAALAIIRGGRRWPPGMIAARALLVETG